MESDSEYLGLLITFLVASGIAGLMYFLNAVLGPKNKKNPVKGQPFECGQPPFMRPAGQFSVKFYLIAMLFILFDVEIVWLFPWAVVLKQLGWFGLADMAVFLAIIVTGFVYAWKRGALEWEK